MNDFHSELIRPLGSPKAWNIVPIPFAVSKAQLMKLLKIPCVSARSKQISGVGIRKDRQQVVFESRSSMMGSLYRMCTSCTVFMIW